MHEQPLHILLVEDNEGDILLTLETFSELLLTNGVSVVKDGEEAIRYLNKEGEFKEAITPGIIFLDINLPKIDGKELLDYTNTQPHLQTIPVVMLTTSTSATDMEDCFARNAACYLTKPLEVSSLLQTLAKLKNFSLTLIKQQ